LNTGSWRADLDSFSFQPDGHHGLCIIHRRAFGTLIGHVPLPAECERYFDSHRVAFQRAAAAKIQRARLTARENFHLNSRDIGRAFAAD
jgi:hypothetical protein